MQPAESDALASLLTDVGQSNQEAFNTFVHLTRDWATAHALAVVRDWARAEECVQQTYLEVWRTASRFDATRGSAQGWMLCVLRRRAIDEIRASESDRRRLRTFELRTYGLLDLSDTTSDTVDARMDGYVVRTALEVLPQREREVIALSYWEGMSHSQIAQLLGIPLGTVKTRIRSALARLRAHVVAPISVPAP